jgi:hypothetical protein
MARPQARLCGWLRAGRRRARVAAARRHPDAQCSAVRLVCGAYQNDVKAYANSHGIDCDVISTPGFFSTRLEITLSGPEEEMNEAVTDIRRLGLPLGKSSSWIDPGVMHTTV